MRTRFVLKGLCLTAILLISCEKTIPEPIEVVSIEQDFEVFPSQKFENDGMKIFLTVRGKEPDSCTNAYLDANLILSDNNINLQLNGIMPPEDCEEGTAIIQKDFQLPNEPANYNIEFFKDGLISTAGKLIITAEEITLDIENLGGVFILESQLRLITENHVWGFFIPRDGVAPNNGFDLQEVVSEFEFYTSMFNRPEPGQYDYFSVEQDGTVNIPDLKESAIAFALVLDSTDSWYRVTGALDDISADRNYLLYYFTLGNGEVYSN